MAKREIIVYKRRLGYDMKNCPETKTSFFFFFLVVVKGVEVCV